MTLYTVTSPVVKVSIGSASGNRVAHIARRGDVLPEGIDDAVLTRLEERGLIAPVEEVEEPVVIPEGDPSDKWTHDQIDAWAAIQTPPVDLTGPTTKAEKLTLIATAIADRAQA